MKDQIEKRSIPLGILRKVIHSMERGIEFVVPFPGRIHRLAKHAGAIGNQVPFGLISIEKRRCKYELFAGLQR